MHRSRARIESALLLGWLLLTAGAGTVSVGCMSQPRLGGLNPFFRPERSTMATPAQRISEVRSFASRSSGTDTPEQREIVAELVRPLANEPDPLLRQAILETAGAFATPLATQAIVAGLQDSDQHVRQTCCEQLGRRRSENTVALLSTIARTDEDFDVRVAATRAIGQTDSTGKELVALLKDPDPAMQLAAVEAMRQLTGQDLGRDVAAYVTLAERGAAPAGARDSAAPRVARERFGWLPFF